MIRNSQKTNPSVFITATMDWSQVALAPLNRAYSGLSQLLSKRQKVNKWLVEDHFLFFVFSFTGILLLSPKYIVLIHFLIDKYLFQTNILKPDTSFLPRTPDILISAVFLALFTFFLSPRKRLTIITALSVPLAIIVHTRFDIISFSVLLIFLVVIYRVIKLSLPRPIVVAFICFLSVIFMFLCKNWFVTSQRPIINIAMFQMALIPMLWYSAYEQLPPKRYLNPLKFFIFNCCRVFDAPIMTYKDIFGKSSKSITHTRLNGIKAVYVALFGTIGVWGIDRFADGGSVSSSRGFSLLFMSYLFYLKAYLKVMIGFNTFIGIARLFGVPVRDNFNYWLLARTPNEHWRRWNVLAREWIVTFVFFPIMRSKKWLFVAIMAALLTSGLLHILPHFVEQRIAWFSVGAKLFYWTINGLAIYLVLKIPLVYPKVMNRLKISSQSKAWSAVGILLTSAFYAVLVSACSTKNWNELGSYFSRLFSF